jgi:hypothetical protein
MTREDAELVRDEMARKHPDATWLVVEPEPGTWQLVKVGLKPTDPAAGESIEGRPKPPNADDPRSAQSQNFSPWAA